MNVYIWEDVKGVTDNWHDNGGLAVVAESLVNARWLVSAACPCGGEGTALDQEPDAVYAVKGARKRRVYQFPNAGCC